MTKTKQENVDECETQVKGEACTERGSALTGLTSSHASSNCQRGSYQRILRQAFRNEHFVTHLYFQSTEGAFLNPVHPSKPHAHLNPGLAYLKPGTWTESLHTCCDQHSGMEPT